MGLLGAVAQVLHGVRVALEEQPALPAGDPVRERMGRLLGRALTSTTASAREEYFLVLLAQLVPDEARIIAALAGGEPSPLVSVFRRSNGEPVLENASLVGRTAAITLPSLTPRYLAHLLALGLVETGPEDERSKSGYELVLAEADVRVALKQGEFGKVPARVERRTVRLSRLGQELWEAARPDGGAA